ncbi:hypothetical protein L0B53_01885 [Vibrio sp. SS-MA-C1-2]|uniref:hypothetical protein n=1 Tax=Vibrio sp. SS-MA-C1-2 TaxID=2908646 RepID=UPI001F36A7F0|nr:hypothetical protein [Vibrio sp. SS-MA-C1-2]UJF17545.1 hypothetical protein L0B53_01885 [Vibrio sp. SS-MA-C1-2]
MNNDWNVATNIPDSIVEFLNKEHILTLTAQFNDEVWPATCFYVFDQLNQSLIIMTSLSTQHGDMMVENPEIVGTISTYTKSISSIQGVQYRATAVMLDGEEEKKPKSSMF